MFADKAKVRFIVYLAIALMVSAPAHGQHPWQEKPVRDDAEIKRMLGPMGDRNPSHDLHIVWVWGVDKNHERGAHEYGWVMDRYVNTLLPMVPRIKVERAMYFPSDEQWAKADLIVFYAQQRAPWGEREYDLMDAFQKRGGGLMFFHLAILEGSGLELAKRIGLAYATTRQGNGPTLWGPLAPVSLTDEGKKSSLFAGFPDTFDVVDEHYWNLAGNASEVTTHLTAPGGPTNGSTRAPMPKELDGKRWPVVWTHEAGKGRVFATVLGHNYFTFNDPYFRIILLRGMAWTLRESFDPFKPLVTLHLQR
jgi:type 1 glutamine amidotransferase|tara:strand:- start:9663 stop:10583 length:921 start_codon:yes stop_codon:yes gene_type:complete